jgi:hypothetical protein
MTLRIPAAGSSTVTSIRNVSAPAVAAMIAPLVGSAMTAASLRPPCSRTYR